MTEYAFPGLTYMSFEGQVNPTGMTLRDYFAAKAMAVIFPPAIAELQRKKYSDQQIKQLKTAAAEGCYALADAMLEARE